MTPAGRDIRPSFIDIFIPVRYDKGNTYTVRRNEE